MIKQKLQQILSSEGIERSKLIDDFQQIVWNDEKPRTETQDVAIWDILSTLAYDLDFYESDAKSRLEDSSYYGDERLREEIAAVLQKL